MPNHITNKLIIDAPNRQENKNIKNFIDGINDDGNAVPISFQSIRPMPQDLKDTKSPNNKDSEEEKRRKQILYGADNWYEWHIKYWGTKWECYNVQKSGRDYQANISNLEFDTAWCPPIEILKYLSKKFPISVFQLEFADEDLGYNCGSLSFKDGKIIEEEYLTPGSEEADRFACDVKNYDYEELMADRAELEEERVAEIEKDVKNNFGLND